MYHDMGLIGTALLPLAVGIPAVLLDTMRFVRDPLSWPLAMARYRATCSGGPDFAYRMLVDRHDPARLEGADLSNWRVAFNGSEPVSAATMNRFAELYQPYGFRASAFYPCYGLAEATLFVSGPAPGTGFPSRDVSRAALQTGLLAPDPGGQDTDAVTIVSSGAEAQDTRVVIRRPDATSPHPVKSVRSVCDRRPSPTGTGHAARTTPGSSATRSRARTVVSCAPATSVRCSTASSTSSAGRRT